MAFLQFFSGLLALSSIAAAAPTSQAYRTLSSFYLTTTSSSEYSANSSNLPDAVALGLFDPYYQENVLLRLTQPGYLSLPNFTLTDSTLHTVSSGPHGLGTYEYNSTAVMDDQELQFLASPQSGGNVGLKNGYLLSVNDQTDGWTLCAGDLSETVVSTFAMCSLDG